jgi:translation elongation factor EF-Ts
MDALTIIGLVSNVISFIDFGSTFVKEEREMHNSASGATGDALSHGLIAGEMRKFVNELVPSGQDQAVNKK